MESADRGDGELIAALQRRESNALANVYEQYGQLVYSLFVRITHEEAAAEDLTQELFLRVWNRARGFDAAKGSLGTWILSIARNMAIDYIRSAQVRFTSRTRSLDRIEAHQAANGGNNPESTIDQARTLKAAFDQLSLNQKRVLELAYFEGFSQSEIAARLNQPLGTVKGWMRSAIARLRSSIKRGTVV